MNPHRPVMRRIGLAALAVGTIGALALLAAVPASTPSSLAQVPTETPAPTASACAVHAEKVAAPTVLLLGETVDITLTVSARCLDEAPLHLVLGLDASGAMAGQPTNEMKSAATQLVQRLDLENHPERKIGVVQFGDSATKLCDLTNDTSRVVGCIRRVGAAGGSAVDGGIREGLKVLIRGRPVVSGRDAREVMIVLNGGGNTSGCAPIVDAARNAKSQDVLIVTVCLGTGCDAQCLLSAASGPFYFHAAPRAVDLMGIFERIRTDILSAALRRLTVVDSIPDNLRYVPDSAIPVPAAISPNGDTIRWEVQWVPASGVTFTLKVEPLEPGHQPTNVEARAEYADHRNVAGAAVFRVPYVTVMKPEFLSTPSPALATPTLTPPPPTSTGGSPAATPAATARPTDDGGSGRLWLPKLDRS